MPRKRKTIEERIEDFHSECSNSDPAAVQATVKKALADRHFLLVKHAADLCEEHLFYDLEQDLIDAYQRFLKNPVKNDPNCMAKEAIARVMVALDSREVDFFSEGLRYHQHEPVWGGSEDTAVDLRVSCAMGLVNTSYSRALFELLPLLHDNNAQARKGAVRAISYTNPFAAEAVLRSKAIAGDPDPDVVGEIMNALLHVSPDESRVFVADILETTTDSAIRQSIALAIGASRLDEALEILQLCWDNKTLERGPDHALLFGAILHRSENAFAWLLDVVAEGDTSAAEFIIKELAIYRTDKKLGERLNATLVKRDDDVLVELFHEVWG